MKDHRACISRIVFGLFYLMVWLLTTAPSVASTLPLNITFNKEKAKEIYDRSGGLVSPGTFKRLTQAHKYLASNKYDKAIGRLKSLGEKLKKKHELAQIYQTLGYAYSGKGQEAEALSYFKKALDLKAFPMGPTRSTLYLLSQLLLSNKKYDQGMKYLEEWFQITERPSAEGYILLATVLVEKNQKGKALFYVNKALEVSSTPKESWLQFSLGLNIERGNYRKAAVALKKLVNMNPKKGSYWKMLAGVHIHLDNSKEALSAMSIAYQLGFLKEEKELLNLASLYVYNTIPLSAAQLVEKAINEDKISKSKKNLQFLAQAWLDADEKQKAIAPLRAAAAKVNDGKLFFWEGQIHMEKGRWDQANTAFSKALEKGKLKNLGQVYLYRGQARVNANHFKGARKDFEKLGEFEKYITHSRSWLNYTAFREEAHRVLKK